MPLFHVLTTNQWSIRHTSENLVSLLIICCHGTFELCLPMFLKLNFWTWIYLFIRKKLVFLKSSSRSRTSLAWVSNLILLNEAFHYVLFGSVGASLLILFQTTFRLIFQVWMRPLNVEHQMLITSLFIFDVCLD